MTSALARIRSHRDREREEARMRALAPRAHLVVQALLEAAAGRPNNPRHEEIDRLLVGCHLLMRIGRDIDQVVEDEAVRLLWEEAMERER